MRIRIAASAAAAAAVLLLAACTSNQPRSDKPGPSRTPTADKPLALGTPWRWKFSDPDVAGTTSVLAYTQPVTGLEAPGKRPGLEDGVWATAEVKVCNAGGYNISASRFPWSLAYSDGTRVQVTTLGGGDMPKPEYPLDETVIKGGDCLRGKIPFVVPGSGWPERVVYTPAGAAEPKEWAVPAR
jgi:hypothetical protein